MSCARDAADAERRKQRAHGRHRAVDIDAAAVVRPAIFSAAAKPAAGATS
jgi:hypothetical protein